MQVYYKVWLLENGQRTDLSNFLTFPIYITDRLNDELDTGEITLECMDLKKPYLPKTKFIIERYNNPDFVGVDKYWHFVCDHDTVEKFVGVNGKYTHHISLIEPSVIAQGMHCDNFALTYELNDVKLNYKTYVASEGESSIEQYEIPSYNMTYKRGPSVTNTYRTLNTSVGFGTGGGSYVTHSRTFPNISTPFTTLFHDTSTLYVQNSFRYEIDDVNALKTVLYRNGLTAQTVRINVPKIKCMWRNASGVDEFLFYLPSTTKVYREIWTKGGESFVSRDSNPVATLFYNPTNLPSTKREVFYKENNLLGFYKNKTQSGTQSSSHAPNGHTDELTRFNSGDWAKCPALINCADTSHTSTTLEFDTEAYSSSDLDQYEYHYVIEFSATPYQSNSMLSSINMWDRHYNYKNNNSHNILWFIPIQDDDTIDYSTGCSLTLVDKNVFLKTRTICRDTSAPREGEIFLMRGVKYNCYDILRKAMLTCDTYIINNSLVGLDELGIDNQPQQSIDFPIIVGVDDKNNDWALRMKNAQVHETIFEQKNLWEVIMQIGYYLHAVPYLEFAEDTDKFVLKFRQLGDTSAENLSKDNSTKLTVFNSLALQDYFSAYDSYVSNFYSPQNLVSEFLCAKTSDGNLLVKADTAEIQTQYGILELVNFGIGYRGQVNWDAINYVFEKSIYDILTNNNPEQISPAKGCALYFELGDNKIQGLNYVAPQVNNGDGLTALKYIVARLFGGDQSNLDVNELRFIVEYRTQDSARVTQFRPDLMEFIKNSPLEKYPHHENFFGQQDKIVDSERFTMNLWGKLIRVGNNIYECQEYAQIGQEREAGDLIEIENERYFATEVDNELYGEISLQKVKYSKNFNQIANIVTIPSEPRFYEVSERSKIRREVRLQDFFYLSATPPKVQTSPRFFLSNIWQIYLKSLLFDAQTPYPNYVSTFFIGDSKRKHTGENGITITADKLFPSSDVEFDDGSNSVNPTQPLPYALCCVPCLHFPIRNGIIFEWDMMDNFKAGDYLDAPYNPTTGLKDGAYMGMQSLRYCDVMGRADLFSYIMFYSNGWTENEIQKLPKIPLDFNYARNGNLVIAAQNDGNYIALDKDNREALSFNLQLNLLHDNEFVTFPNIFGEKENSLKCALCRRTVSLFDEKISLQVDFLDVQVNPFYFAFGDTTIIIAMALENASLDDVDSNGETLGSKIKSIVFYDDTTSGTVVYFARNVDKVPDEHKLDSMYIYPVYNNDSPSGYTQT